MFKNLSFSEKFGLFLNIPIAISALVQFFNLWAIDFFYIKFFSFNQLARDCFFVLPLFFLFLCYILTYMHSVLIDINNFFINIQNIKDSFRKDTKNIYKYFLKFLISIYTLFCIIIVVVNYDYIYTIADYIALTYDMEINRYPSYQYIAKLIYVLLLIPITLNFSLFYLASLFFGLFSNCCFHEKYKNWDFYEKFLTIKYYIDYFYNRKKYNNQSEYLENSSEKRNGLFIFFALSLLLISIFVKFVFLPINNYIHEYSYEESLNLIELNSRIKNKYLKDNLNIIGEPKILYINGEYIFYEINIDKNKDKISKKVLIIKTDEIFNIEGIRK